MKTLYLVRHAKSDWADEDLSDIDRPLNKRGYRDAKMMSELMKEKKMLPDLIITSPAIRAITTALIFCRNFNLSYANIVISSNLYATDVKHYMAKIGLVDNRYQSIMLFGHNPIITDLANTLTKAFTQNIPTSGIVGIRHPDSNADWKTFTNKAGELIIYDFPKKQIENI